MSRSRKKYPVITDQQGRTKQPDKRLAVKAMRNRKDISNGMAYRKAYCSYKIRDWRWWWPEGGWRAFAK